MKRFLFYIVTAILSITSCTDTTDQIGMSLIGNTSDAIEISSTMFDVESQSVLAGNVVSSSTVGYLGKVKDPETNAYVTCNYMTQVLSNGSFQFPEMAKLSTYDASKTRQENLSVVEADSCELVLYFNGHYGDSLSLMKVVAHELEQPFKEGVSYNVDEIDNIAKSFYRKGNGSIHSQNSYTVANRVYTAKVRASSTYTPNISISLNDKYIDKDGVEYKNYGTYLMRKYYTAENNDTVNKNFLNDYLFNKNICPGFYVETVSGIGSMARIYLAQLLVHFRFNDKGKTDNLVTSFVGTEEVLQKTAVIQDKQKLDDIVADNSCTFLKVPAGIFTQLTIPVENIMRGHENDSVNTTRIFIPRENNTTGEEYKLAAPTNLLLLPADSVESFFAKKKVADNRTSYLCTYSSSNNGYTFNNISTLVNKMYKGTNRDANWNKVVVIPVETTTSTVTSGYSQITKVSYAMALGTTRLSKGTNVNSKIKASVIYSKYGK